MNRVHRWASARSIFLPMGVLAVVLATVAAWAAPPPAPLRPAEVLDRQAMSLSPTELLSAAMSLPVPTGEGMVTVARQMRYAFDSQGRATVSWRGIVRIVTTTGARSFGPLESEWAPWHEERPKIRARVITSNGRTYAIDERTITEQPIYSDDAELHSDRRTLKVPLPALQPGSVIEYEIIVANRVPLFQQGVVFREYFTASSATGLIRLILDAPSTLPLRYAVHGLTSPPRRSQAGTSVRFTFERGDLLAKSNEAELPPGMTPLPPHVEFSTGGSWKQIASAYSAVVNERLSASPLTSLAQRIAGAARSRKEIVQRLLRYLHAEVRYTAVELGESALLPRTPAETLDRKFGDCKDQATLLVGLLRSLGLPASVALLRTGVWADVERNLPGIGLFNHAIVYLPAQGAAQGGRGDQTAMWVDPTLEYGQPDELPFVEQGRLALIASPSTTALVSTPVRSAMSNRIRETREVYLAEYGPARIIETTEAWGSADRLLRGQIRQLLDERSLEKHFSSYAVNAYDAQGEVRTQTGTPEDLETPSRIRVEAARARRGYTALLDAIVTIPVGDLVGRLPEGLQETSEEPEIPERKSWSDLRPYRFEPLVHEWGYRIVVPPGFQATALPQSEVVALGPARLSKTFSVEAGNMVTAMLRFDSGPGSLSLEEYYAMRRAIAALRKGKAITIRFEQIAEAHLAAGRFREAYLELRRLVDLHPGEALHLAQLANALSKGGLGESARQLAARAVALEPHSGVVQRLQGTILMRDLSGNLLSPGWDRAGAVAALRRARSLEPENRLAQYYLALCLERNSAGTEFGPGSDLNGAIMEWRTLSKRTAKPEDHAGLFEALLAARRYGELEKAIAEMPKGELHDAALIVQTALTRGAAEAVESARSFINGRIEQRAGLVSAAHTLMRFRNYPLARALFAEAATDASNAKELQEFAAVARHMRRHEDSATLSRPTDLMQQYMARALLDDAPGAPELRSLFGPQMTSFVNSRIFEEDRHQLRSLERKNYPSADYYVDVLSSFMDASAEGNDRIGFLVESEGRSRKGFALVVAKQRGSFQIIGQSDFLQGLGYEAAYHLDRGELSEAHQLLVWARALLVANQKALPLSLEAFPLLWTQDEPVDADRLRIAAAALSCTLRGEPACPEPHRGRALAVLADASARFSSEPSFGFALASFFERTGRYEDALSAIAQLRMRGLLSPAAEVLEVISLHKSGRTAIAKVRLESMLRALPQAMFYWQLLAEISQDSGDFTNAEFCWRKLQGLGAPGDLILPHLSWLAVLTGKVTSQTEADARQGVKLTKEKDLYALRVLAATLIEKGKAAEAVDILHQISTFNEGERAPADHYLVGRLAESFGEQQAAVAAYSRIRLDKGEENKDSSLGWLAERRLAEMMKVSRY